MLRGPLGDAFAAVRRSLRGESVDRIRRSLSDATGKNSKTNLLSEETPLGHRLFENARMPVEGAAAQAETSTSQAATAAEPLAESSAVGKVMSTLGNIVFYGAVGASAFFGYYHYAYNVDQLEKMIEETGKKKENQFPGYSLWQTSLKWYAEKRRQIESELKKYADPPSDRLLPDLPPHARHIKTLVLDLDDVLIHSDWTRARGWRTFKRPGAEEFIRDMSQYYELVVYTSQLPTYADPILDRLDPQRMLQYRLYRDSTRYVDGKHVRDLAMLNRDLKQVLLITADPEASALQPENAIKLKKWTTEEKSDTTLLDLLPFLEAIVRTNVHDVRDVVKSYDGQDIPTAFRERMSKVQEAKAKRQQASRGFLGGR